MINLILLNMQAFRVFPKIFILLAFLLSFGIFILLQPQPVKLRSITEYYSLQNSVKTTVNTTSPITLPSLNSGNFKVYYGDSDHEFNIDDTDQLESMRDLLSCVPESFGYSVTEGNLLFPRYIYPDCSEVNSKLKGELEFDTINNKLILTCPSYEKAKYVIGPRDNRKLIPNDDRKFKVRKYNGNPVDLKGDEEYVLATCGEKKFNLIQTRPRFKQEVYDRAMKKSRNYKRMFDKPVTIANIIIDSFSRRHFFRKLENTIQLLNNLNRNSTHAVYDFKIHNINGPGSIENMVASLAGTSKSRRTDSRNTYNKNDIWNLLSDLGFVTYVGQENCNAEFEPVLGPRIEVDHSVNEFYCAASSFSQYSTNKLKTEVHRCIGKRMSHEYIMDYTLEYLDTYKDADKWFYIHLNAAHEGSGQHATTLDQHLPGFINKLLARDEVVFIFLEGDHGMRYGNWRRSEEAFYEWKLPAFFPILPHEYLSKMPESYNLLLKNSYRLTSKYDTRATILDIADAIKRKTSNVNEVGVVLYKDLIPSKRSCRNVRIPMWHCSCVNFETIDPVVYSSQVQRVEDENFRMLRELLQRMAFDSVEIANNELFSKIGLKTLCYPLSLREITQALGYSFGKYELIKIEFSVNESAIAKFEASMLIGEPKSNSRTDQIPVHTLHYRGAKKSLRFLYVNRVDPYAGQCEKLSIYYGAPARYCICRDPLPGSALSAYSYLESLTSGEDQE
jgi:hypothetical protein